MNPAIFQQPFFQVTLPLMVTFIATMWIAQWAQNKRFDDLNKRFDDLGRRLEEMKSEIVRRLDAIDAKLDNHHERIIRLEADASPIARGRG